jgi:hypothetical protein
MKSIHLLFRTELWSKFFKKLFKNSAVVCFTNSQDISSTDNYQLFLLVNYK